MSEIDNLKLNFTANSGGVSKSINDLKNSLSKLKTATSGGVGLSKISSELNGLVNATNRLTNYGVQNITNLVNALQSLKTLKDIKISSSISNQMNKLTESAQRLSGVNLNPIVKLGEALKSLDMSGIKITTTPVKLVEGIVKVVKELEQADLSTLAPKVREFTDALRSMENFKATGMSALLNAMNRLPNIEKSLRNINLDAFSQDVKELSKALAPLAREFVKIGNVLDRMPSKFKATKQAMQKTIAASNGANTNGFISSAGSFITPLNAIQTAFAKAYTYANRVITPLAKMVGLTNQYVEDMNLFSVSLGEYAQEAYRYAKQVSEVLGIDPGEFMRNQGLFMTLADGFGVASDRAYIMSKNLTQLGYDLSSFFNIPVVDTMAKLQSGLAGELEPLRRIGYDLSKARLEAEALALGITKTYNEMTQAEKAQLRYHVIMTQVTQAQGDMARTLTAPANQLRVLQAQLIMAGRAIGSIFIPMLNAILPFAIAAVKVIRMLADAIARLFGSKLPDVDFDAAQSKIPQIETPEIDKASDASERLSDNLKDNKKKAEELRNSILSFDQLHVLNDPPKEKDNLTDKLNNKIKTPEMLDGWKDFELPEYDFLGGALESRIDAIIDKLKKGLESLVGLFKNIFPPETMAKIKQIFDDFFKDAAENWENIKNVAKDIWDDIQSWGSPLAIWWNRDVGGSAVASLEFIRTTILGAWDSINKTVQAIWDDLVFPIGTAIIEKGLPTASQIITEIGNTLTVVSEELKKLVDLAVQEILRPIMKTVSNVVTDVIDTISRVWDEKGAPLFEELRESVKVTFDLIGTTWTNILEPVFDEMIEVFNNVWDNHLQPLFEKTLKLLSDVATEILKFWNEDLAPFITWVSGELKPVWEEAWGAVGDVVENVLGFIIDTIGSVIGYLADFNEHGNLTLPILGGIVGGLLAFKGMTAIAGIVSAIAGAFGAFSIATGWLAIKQAILNAVLAVSPLGWIAILIGAVIAVGILLYKNWDVIKEKAQQLWKTLTDTWDGIKKSIGEAVDSIKDGILGTWNTVKEKTTEVWNNVKNFFRETWDGIKKRFVDTWEVIKGVFSVDWGKVWEGAQTKFGEAWDKIKNKITDVWNSIKGLLTGDGNIFKSIASGVSGMFETAVNWVLGGLNDVINWPINRINGFLNNLRTLKVGPFSPFGWIGESPIPNVAIPTIKLSAFANGGFPDKGQMFIAREAGPEMVGSIGGRTAVANNSQIVDAVSAGVAQAVSAVMGTGQGGDLVIQIKNPNEVTAREIYRQNLSTARREGRVRV